MASERPGDASASVTLPESLRDWLDEVAEADDLSREDVLLQLLSAAREGDGGQTEDELPVETVLDSEAFERRVTEAVETELERRLDERLDAAVAERLDDHDGGGVDEQRLDEAVGEVEDRFSELLDDVRERVIQVKREADQKAPTDHDHEELAADLAAVREDLDDLAASVEAVEEQLDAGFDNFESILTHLEDDTGELRARQTTLARALVESRDELRSLAAREASRAAADELRRTANRHGVSSGRCADCESTVDLGLLSRASCPHCSATFVDVDPSTGLFGKTTLETGDRPALEPNGAEDGGYDVGIEGMIEETDPDDAAEEADRS